MKGFSRKIQWRNNILKTIFISLLLSLSTSAFSYDCEYFQKDKKKLKTLRFLATKVFGYENLAKFCEKENFIDLEIGFAPNLFVRGEEEDDHYKALVHYNYSSCTFVYNYTRNKLTSKRCYSTW